MNKILKLLSKDHAKWLRIVKSFGLEEDAEDLVQDMYLKIYNLDNRYIDTIMFNEEEVNHYFIFRILRNMFLDKCKKKKYTTSIEVTSVEPISLDQNYEYKQLLDLVNKEIDTWHLYDKRIYDLVLLGGFNMMELSRRTNIDYDAIRRTRLKLEKWLKNTINEI